MSLDSLLCICFCFLFFSFPLQAHSEWGAGASQIALARAGYTPDVTSSLQCTTEQWGRRYLVQRHLSRALKVYWHLQSYQHTLWFYCHHNCDDNNAFVKVADVAEVLILHSYIVL